jgi:hypothetical protein
MNATAHLLSTKANKKRLFGSIAQDKRANKGELKEAEQCKILMG